MIASSLVPRQARSSAANKRSMKLFKFSYSPYARKVQAVLDLSGLRYHAIEVPYGDRSALVAATGGYMQVPVLVTDAGTVLTDSRSICEHVLRGEVGERLVPSPLEGPIWAYADFADDPLEDVLFRLASPQLADKKSGPVERALFVYVKERKFGGGCVARWALEREELLTRGRKLLAPTAQTLSQQPFLFGALPTLADAALYGNLKMLESADPALPSQLGEAFPAFMERLSEVCAQRSNVME